MGHRPISITSQASEQTSRSAIVFMFVAFLCAAAACSKSSRSSELRPTVSSSPAPSSLALPQTTATPAESSASQISSGMEEVANALARVFHKSAQVDQSRSSAFLVGDFNGDASPDLAVFTKANDTALAEINSELANWTLEDPHEVPLPGTKAADQLRQPKPVKAERNEQLLAIIHGVGPQGWRNPEARQAFLLRKAVGINPTIQTAAGLREPSSNSSLTLRGDAISESVDGHRGLIFWTGAKYAWAPQP